jgi:hypothetical protein
MIASSPMRPSQSRRREPTLQSACSSSEQLETWRGNKMHQAQASPCPSPGRPGLDPMGEAREQQPGTPEKTGKPAKVRQGARETQGEPDHRSQSARPLPCHMGCHPHPAVSIRHLTWLCPFPQGPPRNNNTPIPPSSHPKQQPSHSVCTPYGTQEQQHQEQEHQAHAIPGDLWASAGRETTPNPP